MTNVHRHSGAQKADVSLTTSRNDVILSVRDHGDGLSADVLQSLKRVGTAGGVGLAGMIERIREIGGELDISSTDYGTEIMVRVPALRRAKSLPEILTTPIPEVKGS